MPYIGDGTKQDVLRILEELKPALYKIGLMQADGRLRHFYQTLWGGTAFSHEMLASEIEGLQGAIKWEFSERKFAFIPPINVPFFERDDLFGEDFALIASPELNRQIKNAGNCIAADVDTGAVYYLMCVVECGLRALAEHLKVRSVKKDVPIEHGTWEEIIQKLEKRVEKWQLTKRSLKRQIELDFYNELLMEFRGFKDCWRNKVAHARVTYDHNQALSALIHVQKFMQKLSERIPLK
ncbi:MAG: hypothetical protein AAB676_02685 [Verrucomicrobiota bacterium]